MATRKRKLGHLGRRLNEAFWDSVARNAPPYIKALDGRAYNDRFLNDLNDKRLDRVGVKFSEEDGQLLKHTWEDKELGANANGHAKAQDDAGVIKDKYPDLWGKRGRAKIIAYHEGLSVRTIQKYFKRFP